MLQEFSLDRIGKLANFSGLFTGETRELNDMTLFVDTRSQHDLYLRDKPLS
jgi:hypothetical protein